MVYTFSNLTVTNITNIDNFKFNDFTNIIYINNTINTDSNQTYNISNNNTNCTFIIGNINKPIYNKKISHITKYPNYVFTSYNHNLKLNDLITLDNIKKNNISLINDSINQDYIIFKVIETTRNTFRLKTHSNFLLSHNNITNIFKTSSKLINSYFNLRSSKTHFIISQIKSENILTLSNHNFYVNDLIQFENPPNLNHNYINSYFKISLIDNNNITIVDSLNNQTDIFTNLTFPHTINSQTYAKLIQSNKLSKNISLLLPSISSPIDNGAFYKFTINDNINTFTIKTSPGDILLGSNKISSSELITSDLVHTSDNSNQFSISNIDLLYSSIKIINISNNKWYIDSLIVNNVIKYTITYNKTDDTFKLNDSLFSSIKFYTNFVYELNISSETLLNSDFTLIDSLYNPYLNNVSIISKPGYVNAKIIIYFDTSITLDKQIFFKYKKNTSSTLFKFLSLGFVKSFPNPFSIV